MRGALMLSYPISGPDAEKFAYMKSDSTSVTGANISLRADNAFMSAALDPNEDGTYKQQWPEYSTKPSIVKEINAKKFFRQIAELNWKHAEPGMLFWDTILKESPADLYPGYKTLSTNPCGEIPLSYLDSCRLMSVNLTSFVVNKFEQGKTRAGFNHGKFEYMSKLAMTMMDNLIELEIEKIESLIKKVENDPENSDVKAREIAMWKQIKETAVNGRRSGLSIIGHGDMLAMLNMRYGSVSGYSMLEGLHKKFAEVTYKQSIKLAETRGAFPAFNNDEVNEAGHPFLERINVAGVPRRNIAILTIPPSGTLSILLNNQSSGIEPVFAPYYERNVKTTGDDFSFVDEVGDKFKTFLVVHSGLKMFYNTRMKWKYDEREIEELSKKEIDYVVMKSPYHKATSHFIDPIEKVKFQGRIQKYIDHSISVTHNLPKEATVEDVMKIYEVAWKSGCKGCTVYRDGSRSGVLNTGESSEDTTVISAFKRPTVVKARVHVSTIKGLKYYVLVGIIDGKPIEIFAFEQDGIKLSSEVLIIKSKGLYKITDLERNVLLDGIIEQFKHEEFSTITRLVSLLMKTTSIEDIVKQLRRSTGIITEYGKVLSRVLKTYAKLDVVETDEECEKCGGIVINEGGCNICKDCGHSTKCS